MPSFLCVVYMYVDKHEGHSEKHDGHSEKCMHVIQCMKATFKKDIQGER